MFDNEIDWVIQGRAHCKAAVMRRKQSVQSKKSVFRSATRERVSVASCSQAKLSRLSPIRTEAIRLPALELILWSSY